MRISFGSVIANLLFGLSWIAWIFMLAGAGAMQSQCGGYFGRSIKIKGIDTYVEGCTTASVTSFIWWATVFEFIVLCLLSAAQCARRQGLLLTKQIYLSMVSVVMMESANRALIAISDYDGGMQIAAQVNAAGTVVCIMCNLVMMLVFGGEVIGLLPGQKEVGEPQPNFAEMARAEVFTTMGSGGTGTALPAYPPAGGSSYQTV